MNEGSNGFPVLPRLCVFLLCYASLGPFSAPIVTKGDTDVDKWKTLTGTFSPGPRQMVVQLHTWWKFPLFFPDVANSSIPSIRRDDKRHWSDKRIHIDEIVLLLFCVCKFASYEAESTFFFFFFLVSLTVTRAKFPLFLLIYRIWVDLPSFTTESSSSLRIRHQSKRHRPY